MFDPGPSFYMQKIAVGPECVGAIDITASVTQNLRWIAKSKQESVRDLTVVILDRPRHADLIDEVRSSGARIRLITDGDVYGAIASAWPGAAIDVLIGIGGTPEGVIAAAALKSMGGEMQARLCPQSAEERSALAAAGFDLDRVLDPGRPGPGRQLLLRRDRRHRRPSPARRAVRRPRRPHAEPGDALPQRHRASDRRLAQSAQAARVQRDRLHLIRSGGPLRSPCDVASGASRSSARSSPCTARRAPRAPCWRRRRRAPCGRRRRRSSTPATGSRGCSAAVLLTLWNSVRVRPGAQRGDVHAALPRLLVQALGEARDVRLGRRVHREIGCRLEAGEARHVEQPAATTRQHHRQRGVRQSCQRRHVDVDLLGRAARDRARGTPRSCRSRRC